MDHFNIFLGRKYITIELFGYSHILYKEFHFSHTGLILLLLSFMMKLKKKIVQKLTDNRFYNYQTIPQFKYDNSLNKSL